MKDTNYIAAEVPKLKLFEGERLLVIISLIGFALAAGIAIYIAMFGAIISPEGNVERAFSFDAAIAIFILSLATLLPVSGLSSRKRTRIRWFFIPATLFAYGVETLQQFRGINPRFPHAGTSLDTIVGISFGVDSLLIVIVTVLLAIPFFRKKPMNERPHLVLGIRYAFLSTMLAFAAGLWMIAISSRYTGVGGNIIVFHGLGFHALQALPLLGWLLERASVEAIRARRRVHAGGIAWMIAIVLIGWQTVLGRTVFEMSILPILAGAMLLISVATIVISLLDLLKSQSVSKVHASSRP
ncbi:hypothetical protein [Paenibacillus sp. SI8]|uniref:hypothetical protein n=1 Tax=unclassified Paenibacillus TaxID=185978 RepID=UPI0034673172